MNVSLKLRTAVFAAALLLQGLAAASAATLYWDADGDASNNNVDGTGLGGAGSWSGAGLWWDGVATTNQSWVSGSEAVFTGTPGTVTVGSTVASMVFGVTGYTVQNIGASTTLEITHVSGSAATLNGVLIKFSNTADVVWPGSVDGGSGTVKIEKTGAGKLDIALIRTLGTYGAFTIRANAGRVTYTSGTAGDMSHTYFTMEANTSLDVGRMRANCRSVSMSPSAVITSSLGGAIAVATANDDKTFAGTLEGNLILQCNVVVDPTKLFTISGNNTHSGGYQAVAGLAYVSSGPAYVDSDTGLGTGPVKFLGSSGDSRPAVDLRFRSPTPSIGSLESIYRTTKNRTIYLGKTTTPKNNTQLSVGALNTDTVYNDWIADFAATGATGSLRKVGSGYLVLTEAMTYAGRTTVEAGTLQTVKKDAFAAGTLKYSCVNGSPTITITTGSTSLLALGQLVSGGTGVPADSVVRAIAGNSVTLDRNATSTQNNQNLSARLASSSIRSDILVNGGTFNGTGQINYSLNGVGKPIVLTSGTLDVSTMPINFTDTPTEKTYTLVDYSAGGSLTTATGVPATANTFASAANVPAGYKWSHDTVAKTITLFLPPAGSVLMIQ